MLRATPPGEDGSLKSDLMSEAERISLPAPANGADGQEQEIDFLRLVRAAEDQALLYQNQINRKSWARTYRAFHNQHSQDSKYHAAAWKGRSKLFRPKTRSAVFKDEAAVAASLFGTIDAISCGPGNEGDPRQRAAAAVIQEIVNYRTDRTSGKAAMPWFLIAMGARQDSLLSGVCCSKQYWKLELRKEKEPELVTETNPVTGEESQFERDVWEIDIDRPDVLLIPPENYVIDPAADWTNPIQSSAYFIAKFPVTLEEVKRRQNDPRRPWKHVPDDAMKKATDNSKFDASAIRRAREMGLDRLDPTQTGDDFSVIWAYEVFIRVAGEDYSFFSLSTHALLTEPKPVREVYPEQFGERPYVLGYGSLESHRLYPMSPAESWQQYQMEQNDLANLTLDALKQNVLPIPKVRRGRQVDLEQLQRRAAGSAIMVQAPEDVTFDRAPPIDGSIAMLMNRLDLDFDDQAGQFNGGTVGSNNNLDKTLGGLRLVAGAANAVQEFAIRVWIETWAEPVLSQVVRLIQYYESDPTVIGLAGEKAKLHAKYGIDQITDDLLEQQITIRVNVGLGAGDPQQRLMKFQSAFAIAAPIWAQSQEFMSGEMTPDLEAINAEVFGNAGYRDGGARFIKKNPPKGPPQPDPLVMSEIEENKANAENKRLTGMAAVKKVEIEDKRVNMEAIRQYLEHVGGQQDRYIDATERDRRFKLDEKQASQPQGQPQGGDMPMRAGAALPAPQGGPPPGMPPQQAMPPGPGMPPQAPMTMPPGGPPMTPAAQPLQALGREQIEAALAQMNTRRQKGVRIAKRDPMGRMSELVIDYEDDGQGPMSQAVQVNRGLDGSVAGLRVRDL